MSRFGSSFRTFIGLVAIAGSLCGCAKAIPSSGRVPPSQYFDLSGFKLTLPIDAAGGSGGANGTTLAAHTLMSAQLTAGFVDDYFYADESGRLVFTAPATGAVTTPGSGSDHTRSELREVYSGAGADSNNDWTSAIGGTLTANCAVQSVASSSDEATIGQIHNQSVAFALLMYRPAQKDVALSLYTTLSSGTAVRTPIATGLALGASITYKLVYSGTTLAVTVNGLTQNFAVDASWAGTPMYFKLGAYHSAPNTGSPSGDQTQVSFSAFKISH